MSLRVTSKNNCNAYLSVMNTVASLATYNVPERSVFILKYKVFLFVTNIPFDSFDYHFQIFDFCHLTIQPNVTLHSMPENNQIIENDIFFYTLQWHSTDQTQPGPTEDRPQLKSGFTFESAQGLLKVF